MPVPTGQVQILDGTTLLGTVNLDSSGNYTFANGSLAAGMHGLTAVYQPNGDPNWLTSTSPNLNEVVNAPSQPQPTQTSIAATPNPATVGQTVTVSGSVTAA